MKFALGFLAGALVIVGVNHLRYAVFPITGGPDALRAVLGGPTPSTIGTLPAPTQGIRR